MLLIHERKSFIFLNILAALGIAGAARAQSGPAATATLAARVAAPAAAPVAMGSCDPEGHLVVRAMRLPEKLAIDGTLDESTYRQVLPVSDFVQAEPQYNEPATEQPQLWLFFDDRAIYVGIRCLPLMPSSC
ncbi:MAG: hypothetical protein EXQ55_02520 [Acidobacteria bacterium]|nr:hypothetical protein [Acidobacteriota bacterium]